MAATPPNTNIEGFKKAMSDGLDGVFNKGVKHGRYLALQEYIHEKRAAWPKWISTKDRLPEGPGGILICAFGSIVTFATLKENGVLVTKNFDVWNINDSCVTHWMPLPEPPKEEE